MAKLKKLLNTKTFGLIIVTAVLIVVVQLINPGFLLKPNIRNMLNTLSFQGPLLAAFAILLMSGNFDFSNVGVAVLSSLIFAAVMKANPNMPWQLMLILAILSGAAMGLFNVFLMNVVNLMPFIATMATSTILNGIATLWTHGNQIPVSVAPFTNLAKVAVFGVIPLFFIVSVVIVLLHAFVLYKTRFGRNIYMIGGNPNAARLCGLNIKWVRGILFMSSGFFSSIAGLIWVALRKQANPATFILAAPGSTAMIGTLIGGVSFIGGAGGMGGAAVGMVLLNVFNSGLAYTKAPAYITYAMNGLLLIFALILDNFNAMRMKRMLMVAAIKQNSDKKEKSSAAK